MKQRGINYDVGILPFGPDRPSRVIFDPQVVRRELEIIRNDLHCNCVRITGRDLDRLCFATEHALALGLCVWFSPALHDGTPKQTLAYFAQCATAAEALRQKSPNIVFVAGWELTFFMTGLVLGATGPERMQTFMKPARLLLNTLLKGSFHWQLNRFLKRALKVVRKHFHGPVTYAAGTWENVDWRPFDMIAVDCYRDANNKARFVDQIKTYFQHGKPVFMSEFGCCTYAGASDKGSYGWAVVDWNAVPSPRLRTALTRDEGEQAAYLRELLEIFEHADAEGAFVFTFVAPKYPHSEDPARDLDLASYAIVKSYVGRNGSRYPDMPWEPKLAFDVLAQCYAAQGVPHDPT